TRVRRTAASRRAAGPSARGTPQARPPRSRASRRRWTPGRSAAAWAATGRASSCRTRTMASRAGSRPRPPFRTRVYDDAGVVAEPLAGELLCRVDLPLDGGPARVERIHVHMHLRLRRPHAVEQSARRVAWCARDVAPTRRDATRPDRVR